MYKLKKLKLVEALKKGNEGNEHYRLRRLLNRFSISNGFNSRLEKINKDLIPDVLRTDKNKNCAD